MMKFNLVDLNKNMIFSWKKFFGENKELNIINDSIFNIKTDIIISPCNSYGFLDGGLDLKIKEFFGDYIEKRIQNKIKSDFNGELLVGDSMFDYCTNNENSDEFTQ